MADHAVEDVGSEDIFVYRGGRAPRHITHARIDGSVEVIEDWAFFECKKLLHVETHNRIRKIGEGAFCKCEKLPRIDIRSVVELCCSGFSRCDNLQFIEIGDKLESIRSRAFCQCPIEQIKLPSVVSIHPFAFDSCEGLMDVEFSEKLESVASAAFSCCERLGRITIPLKRSLFLDDDIFDCCYELTRVDLVGGVYQTIASLHVESWKYDMYSEINRINQVLPNCTAWNEKTQTIREWMDTVIDRLDHYKTEHCSHVKDAATLLELALWKAKLDEEEDNCEERSTKRVKIDADDVRKERRVTCGADTVIKNVLPFLRLLE